MALGEVLQRLAYFGQELNGVILNAMGKAHHLRMQLWSDRPWAQTLERCHQSMGEAVQAVPVGNDAFALDIIQHSTNLIRREFVVIQERDKARDGALEIDIVLPKRVVGVDEEGLGRQASSSWAVFEKGTE